MSLILEGSYDSSSGNKDGPEATDDKDNVYVPFLNPIIQEHD